VGEEAEGAIPINHTRSPVIAYELCSKSESPPQKPKTQAGSFLPSLFSKVKGACTGIRHPGKNFSTMRLWDVRGGGIKAFTTLISYFPAQKNLNANCVAMFVVVIVPTTMNYYS
jgi:hypothetical protein